VPRDCNEPCLIVHAGRVNNATAKRRRPSFSA
jgi:hypothetical protein